MVSGSLSENILTEGSGDCKNSSRSFFNTYTEKFYEDFPYYLAIGMTEEQYWDGTPALAKCYRKADEIKRERLNYELWLQGLYFYDAICDASPLLHAFAGKNVKPKPYPDKPYALTAESRRRDKEAKEESVAKKGIAYMEAFMAGNNKRFKSNASDKNRG